MNAFAFSGLLVAVTSIAMSALVYFSNRLSRVTRFWAGFCLAVAMWGVGDILIATTDDPHLSIIWWRVAHVPVILIPALFYHFVTILIDLRRPKGIVLAYMGSVSFLIANATPYFINNVRKVFGEFYYDSPPGILYPWFFLFYAIVVFISYVELWRFLKRSDQVLRSIQVRWFFLATAIGFVGSILCFPPVFGIDIYPYGNFIIPLYPILVTYAIVRHQLMDIVVVIKRTLVFAGMALGMMAMIAVPTLIAQTWLAQTGKIHPFALNLIGVALIMLTYERMKTWLVNVTDRYLFQKKYDYKVLLKQFADEVVTIIDFKQLLPKTVTALTETVKLETCSLLLLNKDTRTYELAAAKGSNGQAVSIPEEEQFITFLRETHEPINATGQVKFPEAVTERLKQLSARLCLPLTIHEDLIGVLCLGKKKSDEEFTKDDLDILLPLARTVAIAISNAQLFDELAKTQAEAAQKEKLAVIGTLSAGINHEICNPLGIVKTQCEAFLLDLEDGLLKDKPQQDVMERISTIMRGTLKQIDRATAITQKLSSFAKPIKQPTTEPVSVEHEIDEVLTLVGHDLKLEKIEVKKEIPPGLPSIVVDRRQLQEVLFNLIRNAGQAIKPPGSIAVRAHLTDGGHVRIEIEDTGSGISPDKLGKIYDPFFTTKEPGKGTGLGLFIVRQIVERNKGRISVESAVGKGTTFFLDFPAAKTQPALL